MKSKKKFKHCGICKVNIVCPGEEYCALEQFDENNKSLGIANYHVICFKEKFLSQGMILNKTMNLLNKFGDKING